MIPIKLVTCVFVIATALTQCPDKDTMCSRCEGTICRSCISSYPDIYGKCIEVPATKVSDCYNYFKSGQCLICNRGFKRDEDFQCVKIEQEKCEEVDMNDKCTVCADGIRVVNYQCDKTKMCGAANCARCDAADNCLGCKPGFYRDFNGKCVADTPLIQNCEHTDINGKCVVCKYNFYEKSGLCYATSSSSIPRIFFLILVLLAIVRA